jgi:integrase
MVKLRRDSRGNYIARKRLPGDVREAYAALYGPRLEAKFYKPAGTKPNIATQLYNEWLAETERRIAAIRAKRNGEGIALTPRQARALAGEWYEWFIARHPANDRKVWESVRDKVRDQVQEALQEAAGDDEWDRIGPDELWWDDKELREAVRPVLADVGETAQFLAMKGQALSGEARGRFLDHLYDDLSAVLKRLTRIAGGDYSDDGYSTRFPKFESADTGETPQQLFEQWASERKPAQGTVDTWRYVFQAMTEHFKDRSASSITPDEAQTWVKSLVTESRSAGAVANNWIPASKTIFNWAVEHKLVQRNPFANVKLTVPKTTKLRDTQAFYDQEWRTILSGSLKITNTSTPDGAARRWVPWLCAYTGARPGEITQLRCEDVIKRDGIDAIRITPAAGTVKGKKSRAVPLHEHLIEQGFLKFVTERGAGPLFYNPNEKRDDREPTNQRKPRAVQTRQRLAAWVRSLGIDDPELSPLHAWRHTFKRVADREDISQRMSDYITGHAAKSVGAGYGAPLLEDMAKAMKKFPRYAVE